MHQKDIVLAEELVYAKYCHRTQRNETELQNVEWRVPRKQHRQLLILTGRNPFFRGSNVLYIKQKKFSNQVDY